MKLIYLICLSIYLFSCVDSSNTREFNFLHITDIHFDPEYYVGAPNNCVLINNGLGCCRKGDIPKEPYKKAHPLGDYNCDTPLLLINKTLEWIRDNLSQEIDFIIYTGDSVGHHDFSQSFTKNVNTINLLFQVFHYYFPTTPIFPVMGNHDTWPIDQTIPIITYNFLEDITLQATKWLDPIARNNFKEGGYYSYSFNGNTNMTGWKLIIFNSLWYESNNLFHNISQSSHLQWSWLDNELGQARNNSQKVIFLNHIPLINYEPKKPATNIEPIKIPQHVYSLESSPSYSRRLLQILSKFSDIIFLQLYGHTHHDEFQLYKYHNQSIGFSLNGGSLYPSHHDPMFRVFHIRTHDSNSNTASEVSNVFIDYDQYLLNLENVITESDSQSDTGSDSQSDTEYDFKYQKAYSFNELYNVDNITTETIENIYKNMKIVGNNPSKELNIYCRYYTPNATKLHLDKDCLETYKNILINY